MPKGSAITTALPFMILGLDQAVGVAASWVKIAARSSNTV